MLHNTSRLLKFAFGSALAAGLVVAIGTAPLQTSSALAYTADVENACRDDYFRHCAGYPVGSASLRLCMESKSKQLSQGCVSALLDAGLVDRRRLKRGS